MTLNIGSENLLKIKPNESIPKEIRNAVMNDVCNSFKSEFLNRLDDRCSIHSLKIIYTRFVKYKFPI